jgi:DNA-binding response OmpR family regulator
MSLDHGFQPHLEADLATDVAKHQPTVLLVEDDENTLFAMNELLTREGYLVLTAASGHDAIGMFQQPLSPIDLVLLDMRLPDVEGVALGSRIRELRPMLPILAFSGKADPEEVATLVKLGAVCYLRKPIGADELLLAIEKALA